MNITTLSTEIETEIARTQKNKATEYHIGQLKARLAKLRTQLLEPGGGGAAESAGFEVSKSGDARVSLIGFPSVGKPILWYFSESAAGDLFLRLANQENLPY
jgi:uncharacterized protein